MVKKLPVIGKMNIFDDIFNYDTNLDEINNYSLEDEDKYDHPSLFKVPKYFETVFPFFLSLV